MPDINWSKNASGVLVGPTGYSSFSTARQAEESDSQSINTTSTNIVASGLIRSGGRGSTLYGIRRSYFAFNFTGYTTGTITNLAFHFTPTTTSSGTLSNRLAQFEGFGTSTNFNNYAATSWWADISSPLVPYSNAFNINDSTTASSVSLNSTAITDAQNDSYLQVVLMGIGDYNNLAPVVDGTNLSYLNQSSNNTFLRFTYAAPGYQENVNAITSANLNSVNAIATANINKVIGVS
jgi:hypothetical protein